MKEKILIVDDEQDILEFVSYNLRKEGFDAYPVEDGRSAIRLAKEIKPQLIILDVMLPGMDGIEICGLLREVPELKNTAIAFLTARAEDYSQIAGFSAGGDDYIAKPIKPKILISRVKALLKRYDSDSGLPVETKPAQKTFGNVFIDSEKYMVTVSGTEIFLPKKEFILLQLLTSKPSKVFTREEIFDYLWKDDSLVNDRTIDVYIRKLREKLGDDRIKTIKGVGYRFDEIS